MNQDSPSYLLDHPKDTDIIIAVLGPLGSGKSHFINDYFGRTGSPAVVGSPTTLSACTTDVAAYCAPTPEIDYGGRRVVLLDTPGFEEPSFEDKNALDNVLDWIKKYSPRPTLAGIVYVYDPTEKRLRSFCGGRNGGGEMLDVSLRSLLGENFAEKQVRVLINAHWQTLLNSDPEAGFNRLKSLLVELDRPPKQVQTDNFLRRVNSPQDVKAIVDMLAATAETAAPPCSNTKAPLPHLEGLKRSDDSYIRDENHDDIIIMIMGATGSGKSRFINQYLGENCADVGHELTSQTRKIAWYSRALPSSHSLYPRNVILVDTPGFNQTFEDNPEILRQVGVWLADTYHRDFKLAGIVYLHDIHQKRALRSTELNFSVFEKLIGEGRLEKIVIATSHWDELPPESIPSFSGREKELQDLYWGQLLERGVRYGRVGSADSVHAIVNQILSQTATDASDLHLRIQEELLQLKMIIPATDAGRQLKYSIDILLEILHEDLRKVPDDHMERALQLRMAKQAAKKQLKELRIPLRYRLKAFFNLN
ncbi:hypothetical protein FA15DRAFT_61518 [Coprinopsis marcescibilis]|uniref:G domain-containing protein n=1 Tax=Coprinopsis marcescibilis TaxID=230819 RepID=A0A5C3L6P3_COPMA|nr:hypothetical protein FA15DRAFT_61518 [Coprinopsis marcescibilis]